jgi:hypothetical protein
MLGSTFIGSKSADNVSCSVGSEDLRLLSGLCLNLELRRHTELRVVVEGVQAVRASQALRHRCLEQK